MNNRINLKTLAAGAFALAIGASAMAQPTDLFFSEYIEGSSNNKALEIYNGTGAAINLSAGNYAVLRYNNGSATVSNTYEFSSEATDQIVADGDVYVIGNSSGNAAILAAADVNNATTFYNGDDALVLVKDFGGTDTIIDSIGQVGFDPGTAWNVGGVATAEQTLVRKSSVMAGDTNPTDVYDPSVEWDSYPQDTTTDLGMHTIDAPPVSGITVDGDTSDGDYVSLGSYTQGHGFGSSDGILELKAYVDSANLYVAINGAPQGSNGFVLFIGHSSADGAVTLPDGDDGGVFGGAGGTVLDFEASYGIRTEGGGAGWTSIIDYTGGGNDDQFAGQMPNDGSLHSFTALTGIEGAYVSSGDLGTVTTEGVEYKIPLSTIGASSADRFELFAAHVSSTGFWSSDVIPEVPGNGSANFGNDPDFSAQTGDQFATLNGPDFVEYSFDTTSVNLGALDIGVDSGSFDIVVSAAEDTTIDSASFLNSNFTLDTGTPLVVTAGTTDTLTFTIVGSATNDGADYSDVINLITSGNNPTSTSITVTASTLFDTTIANLRTEAEAGTSGSTVFRVSGVVNENTVQTSGAAGFSMQDLTDGSAATRGIVVIDFSDLGNDGGPVPSVGDQVEVTGQAAYFNGLVQLVPTAPYTNNGARRVALTPRAVAGADIGDDTEGVLIGLTGINFPAGTINPDSNISVNDGVTTFTVRYRGSTTGIPTFTGPVTTDVTAVGSQFDGSNPLTGGSGYQISPRGLTDLPGVLAGVDEWMILND